MAEELRAPLREGARTMKTDLDELTHKQDASLVDLAARANENRYKEGYVSHRNSGPSTYLKFTVIGLALVVIPTTIGGGIYLYLKWHAPPPETTHELEIPRSFIPTSSVQKIEFKKNDRTGLLEGLQKLQGNGNLVYTPLVIKNFSEPSTLATPKDFFSTLRVDLPNDLLPSLTGRWNMYVVLGKIVFVFEIKDWSKAWGSMFQWEKTISSDLSSFLKDSQSGNSFDFVDTVIKNEDARIEKIPNETLGRISYATALRQFLIVATSEDALREMIERMVAGPLSN